MHDSVAKAFVGFTERLEGNVPHLYADILGLLTCSIGCLADPVQLAISMPWVMPDGSKASADQIGTQWRAVKAQSERLAKLHYKYAAPYSTIRLTPDGVLAVAKGRLLAAELQMRRHFPEWDAMPADAQLCCFSMSWAIGSGWPDIFKNMKRLLVAGDYRGAIEACAIKVGTNWGIVPRNAANRLCLGNAWKASQLGLPRSELYWPGVPPQSADPEWSLKALADDALAKHQADNGASSAGRNITEYEHAASGREYDNT